MFLVRCLSIRTLGLGLRGALLSHRTETSWTSLCTQMTEHPISELPEAYKDGRVLWGRDIMTLPQFQKFAMFYSSEAQRWYTPVGKRFVRPTHYLEE